MDAVTYPHPDVSAFIRRHFIPVRIMYNQEPLASKFRAVWTPTLIILDSKGNELYRDEGYLPPERLLPALMLSIGKLQLYARKFKAAASQLSQLAAKYPGSSEAPEALYFSGVARFRQTKDIGAMRDAYEKLSRAYPGNPWTVKASVYKSVK